MKLYAYRLVIETFLPQKDEEVFLSMHSPESGRIIEKAICVGTIDIKPPTDVEVG